MKLLSMVDYVIETHNKIEDSIDSEQMMFNYAKFLSMHLTLGMFVPTDEDGNVLKEPLPSISLPEGNDYKRKQPEWEKYQKALSNVIFEGFELRREFNEVIQLHSKYRMSMIYTKNKESIHFMGFSGKTQTIEDIVKYNFELTQSTITKYQI